MNSLNKKSDSVPNSYEMCAEYGKKCKINKSNSPQIIFFGNQTKKYNMIPVASLENDLEFTCNPQTLNLGSDGSFASEVSGNPLDYVNPGNILKEFGCWINKNETTTPTNKENETDTNEPNETDTDEANETDTNEVNEVETNEAETNEAETNEAETNEADETEEKIESFTNLKYKNKRRNFILVILFILILFLILNK